MYMYYVYISFSFSSCLTANVNANEGKREREKGKERGAFFVGASRQLRIFFPFFLYDSKHMYVCRIVLIFRERYDAYFFISFASVRLLYRTT